MTHKKCPTCEKDVQTKAFDPFCSKRCADVDLNRWMMGSYVIPETDIDELEDTSNSRSPQIDER